MGYFDLVIQGWGLRVWDLASRVWDSRFGV